MKKRILLSFLLIALISIQLKAQITVTFNVDMTGQYIGPGGVHIAGTFASNNSSTILSDWAPAAPGSELTLLADNIYRIKVDFPFASSGQQLMFLFVRDSIWGDGYQDFSEGNPGETFLNSGCGVDDPYGGFNRVIDLPFPNGNFSATFDHCGTLLICPNATSLQTTNITATSAQLNWNAVIGGSEYNIRFRPVGGNWSYVNTSIANSSLTLSSLTPSTKYQWQIKTRCYFGPAVWSSLVKFKTDAQKIAKEIAVTEVSIYPNPATEAATVRFSLQNQSAVLIEVLDFTGRTVKTFSFPGELPSGTQYLNINTADFIAGTYIVHIRSEEQSMISILNISK